MTDRDGLLAGAARLLPDAVALRRRIHAEPELGLELPATQRAVLEALEGLDLEIETGGATSGIIATLRGDRPGPALLLRADMDALPLQEDTGLAFASRHDGRMHACGHDAHVAMLAGAARLLEARRGEIGGTVKLLFQPGEEGHAGARVMIGEGLLDAPPAVDAAFAIHVDPTLAVGCVALRPGPILAATDVFSIDLEGRGGHASMPHHAVDPIPVACEIVGALQTLVARRIDAFDPVVLSVTRVQAGSTHNVIPETGQILGTLRSFSERSRDTVREGLCRVAEGIAAAHQVQVKVHVVPGYPVTRNDDRFTGFVRGVASRLLGEERMVDMRAPIMGAEDFAYVLDRVPGAIVFLGARPEAEAKPAPLHSNYMCLDESALATGIALHAAVALAHGRGEAGGA